MNLFEAKQLLKKRGYRLIKEAKTPELYYVFCISVINDENSDYQKDTDYTNVTYDDLLEHGFNEEEIDAALEGKTIFRDTPYEDDGYCDGAEEYAIDIMPMSQIKY